MAVLLVTADGRDPAPRRKVPQTIALASTASKQRREQLSHPSSEPRSLLRSLAEKSCRVRSASIVNSVYDSVQSAVAGAIRNSASILDP